MDNIVWVDLEMTGLDINTCHIIEMACIVTDKDLNVIAEGKEVVIHQPESVLDAMNPWCKEHHGKSGLTKAVRNSKVSLQEAEVIMLEFIKRYTIPGKAPLAGNSVHVDRMFLEKYMPNFLAQLHYRIIDVSTIKELSWRWYNWEFRNAPAKNLSHRALDDVKESIKELRYFRKAIFKDPNLRGTPGLGFIRPLDVCPQPMVVPRMPDSKSGSVQAQPAVGSASLSMSWKRLYLVLYNLALVVGWGMVLLKAVTHASQTRSLDGLYLKVAFWLKLSQTAAIMEVAHAALGLVASRVMTTFLQVLSRVCVLWLVLEPFLMADETTSNGVGFPMLLCAWTVTEIVRYSFYASGLLGVDVFPLTWCRYSFFVVLYPIGVAGEVTCILQSIPIMTSTGRYDVSLPNPANFSLAFAYLAWGSLLAYPPSFYQLFTYMLRQRKKVLGSADKKSD